MLKFSCSWFRGFSPSVMSCLMVAFAGFAEMPAVAQTFLFDFGAAANTTEHAPAPDDPVNYWNNIPEAIGTSATGQLTNIVTAGNAASGLGLVMLSRFNGANANGTVAATQFPVEATRDSLFGNTETFNGISNIFPSFKFVGLAPSTAYDFTFYASRTGVGDTRETGYTLMGSSSNFVALNVANNETNVAVLTGIVPNAAGEITISLAPTPNNNNANHFTYLGVLKVDAVPPQTPIGFTLEPVNQRVAEFQTATFTAAVTGAPPYFVQWFSNNLPIPGANQFTYSIPSVTLDMNGSLFSVNVSNLAFSATSSNASLRVVTDTNAPVVVSVGSSDGLTIDICFNEVMSPGSAGEAGNYLVNEGNGDIIPISATLGAEGKCVSLDLGGQRIAGSFTVRVDFLTDISGNEIVSTNASGKVSAPEDQMILIDFGGATTTEHAPAPADDPIRYWNNLTGTVGQSDLGQLSGLVTTQNLATTIGVSMIGRFNGVNENGTVAATQFPTDATRDSMFGNTELFGGFSNIFPSFKLTGLNPAKAYDLTFYASRTGVADNRETQYTIAGSATTTALLNVANNVTNTVTASAVQPSASGEITISLAPGPSNNNANHFTYLGVLGIAPGSASARFLAPTVSGGSINLQWSGSGQLQWAPTVTGPWTTIVPTAPNTHTEPVILTTNRFFRLQVQ